MSQDYTEWNDSHFNLAYKSCMVIETLKQIPADSNRDLMLKVYGHNIQKTLEEKRTMTTENVGEPMKIDTKSSATESVARVSEPRVAQLVEKAGGIAPYLLLPDGTIKVKTADGKAEMFEVNGGVVEAMDNKIVVLA
jgi:hypothetical protein